jgi:hypothetical protein
MTINPSSLSPLEWAFQHLQVLGWPALCWFAWKVSKFFTHVSDIATKTIDQVDKMATSIPAMDVSLKEIAQNTGRRRSTDYDGNRT